MTMKLFNKDKEYIAKNCQKPKFGRNGKSSWDSLKKDINAIPHIFHFDSTWGKYFYFEHDSKWYKLPVLDTYDISTFYIGK